MADSSMSLFGAEELPLSLKPPQAFRVLPRRLATDYCCPRCAYEWATNPKPNAQEAEADLESDA